MLMEGARQLSMPSVANQRQFEEALKEVVNGFRAHVADITYSIGTDWSGDVAIFFHVLLRDQSARGVMLGQVTAEVRRRLSEMLRGLDLDLFGYTDFRSESEAADLHKRRA